MELKHVMAAFYSATGNTEKVVKAIRKLDSVVRVRVFD